MARYASRLLGLEYSADEQVVCIAENDACSVDAIQVMLGCSIGKGDLIGSMFEWMRAFHGCIASLAIYPFFAFVSSSWRSSD